jgi:hypothetical protein
MDDESNVVMLMFRAVSDLLSNLILPTINLSTKYVVGWKGSLTAIVGDMLHVQKLWHNFVIRKNPLCLCEDLFIYLYYIVMTHVQICYLSQDSVATSLCLFCFTLTCLLCKL